MKCPHLIKWVVFSCIANEKPYDPSLFEFEEYCSGTMHKRCPFYLNSGPDKYVFMYSISG